LVEEGAAAERLEIEEALEVGAAVGLGGGFIGAAAEGGGFDVQRVELGIDGLDLGDAGEDLGAGERGGGLGVRLGLERCCRGGGGSW
jgi:hypothetical protein